MKVTVVVVTYYGGYGDEVQVFGSEKEAKSCVVAYAREYWDTKRLGRFPRSYNKLHEAWADNDLWGSTDSRWLEEREVDVPDPRFPVSTRQIRRAMEVPR